MSGKESLKQRAYHAIKEKIISCEYAPGVMLNEETLRDELHVSRTPIRDALSRLEQEGLISILSKKGIVVSGLTINDINFIFEVRLLYEPYAILKYGPKIGDEVIHKFFETFSLPVNTHGEAEYYSLDDAFHVAIVEAIQNPYLLKTYDWIHNQNLRFRVMTGQFVDSRLEKTNEEHLRILIACLKHDWALAAKEMEAHLLASKNATFDLALNKNSEMQRGR
ncbi:GntR family transcriptional regulator [Anaerotignum propionicum]|jgi:DNA-binding GntR family transcriptional regulator|uniref:GntR family transcriptional regulator n=1 Tax=Anaerotignum propionicum TaxID=28446 RepID=UPI000E84ACCE|nr:GntR family transcriptional regulator [Anaerotignum propionicum]MEA4842021.1 GntR family transcriptional regulator [[Clostridium] symbiosum]HBF65733.1 GntR family transcriptional regulator [Clostridium sp.]